MVVKVGYLDVFFRRCSHELDPYCIGCTIVKDSFLFAGSIGELIGEANRGSEGGGG